MKAFYQLRNYLENEYRSRGDWQRAAEEILGNAAPIDLEGSSRKNWSTILRAVKTRKRGVELCEYIEREIPAILELAQKYVAEFEGAVEDGVDIPQFHNPKRLPYQKDEYFFDATPAIFTKRKRDFTSAPHYVSMLFYRLADDTPMTAFAALSQPLHDRVVFIAPFSADVHETLLAIMANAKQEQFVEPARPFWCDGSAILDCLAEEKPSSGILNVLAAGLIHDRFDQDSVTTVVEVIRQSNNAVLLVDFSDVSFETLVQETKNLNSLKLFLRQLITSSSLPATARVVIGVPKAFGVAGLDSGFFENLAPGSVYEAASPPNVPVAVALSFDKSRQSSLREMLEGFTGFNSNSLKEAVVSYLASKPAEALDRNASEDILAAANHFLSLGYLEVAYRLELFCRCRVALGEVFARSASFVRKPNLGLEVGLGHISDVRLLPTAHTRFFLFGKSGVGKSLALRQIEAEYALPFTAEFIPGCHPWMPLYIDCNSSTPLDLGGQFASQATLASLARAGRPQRLHAHVRLSEVASYKTLEYLFSSPILYLLDNAHELANEDRAASIDVDALLRQAFILAYSDESEYRGRGSPLLTRLASGSWAVELDGIDFAAIGELYKENGGKADINFLATQLDQPIPSMLRVPYLVSSLAGIDRIARRPVPWVTRFDAINARVESLADSDKTVETRLLLDRVLPAAAYSLRVEQKRVELLVQDARQAQSLGLIQSAGSLQFSRKLIEDYFLAKEVDRRCRGGGSSYAWADIFQTRREHWLDYYTSLVQLLFGALSTRAVSALVEFLIENENHILAHIGLLELDQSRYSQVSKGKEVVATLLDRLAASTEYNSDTDGSEEHDFLKIARALSYYDPRISTVSTVLKSACLISEQCSIGTFPVTNLEFSRFVRDNGYATRQFWTEAGWSWKERAKVSQPALWTLAEYSRPNCPVVAVSFHEAKAYCSWLSAKVAAERVLVDLPRAREWEDATGISESMAPLVQSALQLLVNDENKETASAGNWQLASLSLEPQALDPDRAHETGNSANRGVVSPPRPIGIGAPNAAGLYDLFESVWQWCNEDWIAGGALDNRLADPNPVARCTAVVKGGASSDFLGLLGGGLDLNSRVHNTGFRIALRQEPTATQWRRH